jgi:hypothetical protein
LGWAGRDPASVLLEYALGEGFTVTGMEQEPPEGLLTVGLVARRSGLTAKALRHCDGIRLLRLALVDGAAGYRLYPLSNATVRRRI